MYLLLENRVAKDPEVQVSSIQCLIDICKIQHDKIGNYLHEIFNFTNQSMASHAEDIAIPATKVWNTIAQEDEETLMITTARSYSL